MVPLGFAFTLTIFPVWLVFTLAGISIVYAVFVSGRMPWKSIKDQEREKGYSPGKIAYAVSVLVLLIIFYRQMHIVAGAWAIMALGDSSATLSGKKWGKKTWPWGKNKTMVGTLAFVIFGTIGSFLMIWYIAATGDAPTGLTLGSIFLIAGVASMVCGFVESFDTPINDNFLVPGAAGGMIYLLTRILLV